MSFLSIGSTYIFKKIAGLPPRLSLNAMRPAATKATSSPFQSGKRQQYASVEEARREQRKALARKQKAEQQKRKKRDEFAKHFQHTVPAPSFEDLPSAHEILGRRAVPPWRPQQHALFEAEQSRCSARLALSHSLAWGAATASMEWDDRKGLGFPDLSLCVHSVSSTFTRWKPRKLQSFEAMSALQPSEAWTDSWVCRSVQDPTSFQVLKLECQIPGTTGVALLKEALLRACPERGQRLSRAAALLEEHTQRGGPNVPFSCQVNVHGCYPYLYVRWPPPRSRANPEARPPTEENVFLLQQALERALSETARSKQASGPSWLKSREEGAAPWVVGCGLERKSTLKGLNFEDPWPCVKVFLAHQRAAAYLLEYLKPVISATTAPTAWDWDKVWGYDAHKSRQYDQKARDEKEAFAVLYSRDHVDLLNAGIDPVVQFTTDQKTGGRRWARLVRGKYTLTPPLPEKRWSREKRAEVLERRHLPTFVIDVHCSNLLPEPEQKPLVELKQMAFDIEVCSRSGGFPSALKGDHIIQIATNTSYDLTEDQKLLEQQDRTVFCLGETPAFSTPAGQPVRIFSYSIRHVFLFLVQEAVRAMEYFLDAQDVRAFLSFLRLFLSPSFYLSSSKPSGNQHQRLYIYSNTHTILMCTYIYIYR